MSSVRRVLLLGSSEVEYTAEGTDDSVTGLLLRALRDMAPQEEWEVHSHITYAMPNMKERAVRLVEHERPEAIVLWLAGSIFADRTVTFALYHRSKRLYNAFTKLSRPALGLAGGGTEGNKSVRGRAYRAANWIAGKAIGLAPLVEPEVARRVTIETLTAFRERGIPVVCRLAHDNIRRQSQAELVVELVGEYNTAVEAACGALGVAAFDPEAPPRAAGKHYDMMPDGLHATLETRTLTARMAASLVIGAMKAEQSGAA